MQLDIADTEILFTFYREKYNNQYSAAKIKDIMSKCNFAATYVTYMNRITKHLVPMGYVDRGVVYGNAFTYYLTEKGATYLEKEVFTHIDIWEDEEGNEDVQISSDDEVHINNEKE